MLLSADISSRIAAFPLPNYYSVGTQSTQLADSLTSVGRCTGGLALPTLLSHDDMIVKGYRVKVQYQPMNESERGKKRESVAQVVLQSMRRLKDNQLRS